MILVDAGIIIGLFYAVAELYSSDLAVSVVAIAVLLWARGWRLRGEIESKRNIVVMAGILLSLVAIQSGTVEEIAESIIGKKQEAAAPMDLPTGHDYDAILKANPDLLEKWRKEDAAAEVARNRQTKP